MAPTVVATLDYVPISLALDGANLYVTISNTPGNFDAKVQTLPKTAVGATSASGGITTLASGLREAGAIAVSGPNVYWLDAEDVFPNNPAIFSVPTAGGTVTEIGQATTYTTMAIANSVLYAIGGNIGNISAFALTGSSSSAAQVIYTSTGLVGIDSDGTSVFFLIYPPGGAAGEVHIYRIPVAGGVAIDLGTLVSGSQPYDDFLVHDATTIYWSDQGTGGVYSLPKTGGTPKLLATFPVGGSSAPQLVLDGDDIYTLHPQSLSRFPKSGGTPTILATAQSGASADSYVGTVIALAVDDTWVYWLYEGHRQILKLAK